MLVQKVNFNYSSYCRKQNLNFKANKSRQNTQPYTQADIEKSSSLDELYGMISFFHKTQNDLDSKIKDLEQKCQIAEKECDIAKEKLSNLKTEKQELEVKRFENEKLFDMAGRRFSGLITKFD